MYCARCWGAWIDLASVTQVAGIAIDGAMRASGDAMACPMCRAALRAWRAKGVVIDRCDAHGVWFDRSELDQLVAHARAGARREGGVGVGEALAVGAVGAVVMAGVGSSPQSSTSDRVDTGVEAVGTIADVLPAVDAAPELLEGAGELASGAGEIASTTVEAAGTVLEGGAEAAGGVLEAIGAIFDIFS